MNNPLTAQDCTDMSEVRAGIDRLDKALVALLAERATFIDRAVALKSENGWPARIPDRVEEVVQNVRREAEAQGLDSALIERIWRQLIDWSIDREERGLNRK
ncbi:chorismate mutase [Cognatishimia sp. SS12]|uniref:chorismate mutase n=1 Tax=Cognatishimia sp. SS12 TaxID=2979465 RepID=UPI00232FB516|nr:chorismate mutase [Cognatishimia sp. SS12]MDC0738774.1 chorismate mutase [Cognatishimia sp. SS12]